jgi:hypothetical protein
MLDFVTYWIFRALLAAIILLPFSVIYLVLEVLIHEYDQNKRDEKHH